jgi:spore maturation protein CgeB
VRFVYFTHSLASCWNHGNAHFLRGVLRELIHAGHEVAAYEPAGAWSLDNLLRDHGPKGLAAYREAYPELSSQTYSANPNLDAMLDGADVVIVHEWNDPALVAAVGRLRRGGSRFTLLFHDTHHRAVSDPDAIRTFDLSGYDGVLAFGEALSEVYRRWGWGGRVFTWHEAADTRLFHPLSPGGRGRLAAQPRAGEGGNTDLSAEAPPPGAEPRTGERGESAEISEEVGLPPSPGRRSAPTRPLPPAGEAGGLVWIGNWGDEERSAELESFLLRPARTVGLFLDIYGVRYPEHALATLERYGARYRSWLPNAKAPQVFARHLATLHVPRRFYVDVLPGIPTIRVFEALACGIPLVSAPWRDSEGLFRPGEDFLVARDEAEMERHLAVLRDDPDLRAALIESGLETIRARHTCAHRAQELLAIVEGLRAPLETAAA